MVSRRAFKDLGIVFLAFLQVRFCSDQYNPVECKLIMHSHTWSSILVSFAIILLFHAVIGRLEAVKCHPREQAALLKFKNGNVVDDGNILESWREGEDCCKWRGITSNNITGYVVQLHLSNGMYMSQVRGKLDPALLQLEHLQYLDLSRSNLGGGAQIPGFSVLSRKCAI